MKILDFLMGLFSPQQETIKSGNYTIKKEIYDKMIKTEEDLRKQVLSLTNKIDYEKSLNSSRAQEIKNLKSDLKKVNELINVNANNLWNEVHKPMTANLPNKNYVKPYFYYEEDLDYTSEHYPLTDEQEHYLYEQFMATTSNAGSKKGEYADWKRANGYPVKVGKD